MRIDVLTIFPEMFPPVLGCSILKRAAAKGLVRIQVHDLRAWSGTKHKKVDDRPYGGGPGMVMRPDPFFDAVDDLTKPGTVPFGDSPDYPSPETRDSPLRGQSPSPETRDSPLRGQSRSPETRDSPLRGQSRSPETRDGPLRGQSRSPHIILLSPQGRKLTQPKAADLSKKNWLILLCGHYEGVDERVRTGLANEEISIGDYILTCGELPAMVLIDSLVRLLPGALGDERSLQEESFHENLLEYPQFTRPVEIRGMRVPEILRSGDHGRIKRWRKYHRLRRTLAQRPDLMSD